MIDWGMLSQVQLREWLVDADLYQVDITVARTVFR